MNCQVCQTALTGQQTKFCSKRCKYLDQNTRNQSYAKQQERGWNRKKEAVAAHGGKCVDCGYNRNYAVLSFHHLNNKEFGLDLRHFANRTLAALATELAKCVLLCMNCHQERHHPTHALL